MKSFNEKLVSIAPDEGRRDHSTSIANFTPPPAATGVAEKKVKEVYSCPRCKDMYWVVPDLAPKHPGFGRAVPCHCREEATRAQRRAYLETIDGLKPSERTLTFRDLGANKNQAALAEIRVSVAKGHGLITLIGPPGTGKSSMLIAAINAARSQGVAALYTTVTDLLTYLRKSFDYHGQGDDAEDKLTYDSRWQLLLRVNVLVLDELSEFNTTPWAMEQFLRLIDERWRMLDKVLTLCATNEPLTNFPPKVSSRLLDGRADVLRLQGPDMRLYQEK